MTPSLPIPVFETKRLILQGVTPDDIPSFQKNFNDYDIISHLASVVPWPYPDDGVKTFLDTVIFPNQGKDRWLWGIFEKNNLNELIGVVELRRNDVDNRGFWLAKKHWNKGYMTEAVSPVMAYAFGTLGFKKLLFSNALGNIRSRKIKEKTGARLIGTKPFSFVNKEYTVAETWELTKQEWESRMSETPLKRNAVRAVLLTPKNEILLMKLNNKEMGWSGWITPGGGVEEGESDENALRRELSEELGLTDYILGQQIWCRTHNLQWDGKFIEQSEKYFLIRTDKFEPRPSQALTEIEQSSFQGLKWWQINELLSSQERFSPSSIPRLLRDLLENGPPFSPIEAKDET